MGSTPISENRMMRFQVSSVGLLLLFVGLAVSADETNARAPKLFFASVSSSSRTTTKTSTLATASYCYTSTMTDPCGRRKKRFINDDMLDHQISPSSTGSEPARELVSELQGGVKAASEPRDGRFFLLFTSTSTVSVTATTTATQYTATLSISVNCVPSDLNMCG